MIGISIALALGVMFFVGLLAGRDRDWHGGQDRKFAFRRGRYVNRVSGEAIPLDEPVIIFRARDRHALDVLRYYRGLATDPHHRQVIAERIYEFGDYARAHPLKEPGITHDCRLREPLHQPFAVPAPTTCPGCGLHSHLPGHHAADCPLTFADGSSPFSPTTLADGERMKLEAPPLRDCPYAHPVGTRCPNCAKWPYPKQEGGNVR